MRRSKRPPSPLELGQAHRALSLFIPFDQENLELTWDKSLQGIPHASLRASTAGVDWRVDVYTGNFYNVWVPGAPNQVCTSLRSMIYLLARRLK